MILRKIMALVMSAAFIMIAIMLPVAAEGTIVKHEGLEIIVQMDKEEYAQGEPITATITVRNTNTNNITIANLAQLIPEGYHLAENSEANMQNIELQPEQTMSMKVTFTGEPDAQDEVSAKGFFDKVIYGETWGIPNLLIAILLIAAFVIFMIMT